MGTLTSDLSLNASTWSVGFSLQRSMVCAQEWGRADKAVRIHASHSASLDFFSAQRRQSTSSIKQARGPWCCSQLHVCCGARRAEAVAAGKGGPTPCDCTTRRGATHRDTGLGPSGAPGACNIAVTSPILPANSQKPGLEEPSRPQGAEAERPRDPAKAPRLVMG